MRSINSRYTPLFLSVNGVAYWSEVSGCHGNDNLMLVFRYKKTTFIEGGFVSAIWLLD
ncbi:hypothetical protein [Vibrio sp. F74]|uniref:hypothetical protein n=1 Tax=Vibrio sp. F74 TaxID=700020 RepID=UPI0035F58391